jgi:hypothetical protein
VCSSDLAQKKLTRHNLEEIFLHLILRQDTAKYLDYVYQIKMNSSKCIPFSCNQYFQLKICSYIKENLFDLLKEIGENQKLKEKDLIVLFCSYKEYINHISAQIISNCNDNLIDVDEINIIEEIKEYFKYKRSSTSELPFICETMIKLLISISNRLVIEKIINEIKTFINEKNEKHLKTVIIIRDLWENLLLNPIESTTAINNSINMLDETSNKISNTETQLNY